MESSEFTRDANGRLVTRHDLEVTTRIERIAARLEAFAELMNERDRRYTEQAQADQRAVVAALVANEKLTSQAFAASKEAILKAEESQKSYNATHNDLTRKMDGQYALMMPRSEAESRHRGQDEKIAELRQMLAHTSGKDTQAETGKLDVARWVGWLLFALSFAWTALVK